jgi:hypothetical protein
MVLLVDNKNDSASSGTTMEKEGKSLDQPEPKRLSLLVDYSKGKAAINKQRKRDLLGDSSQEQNVRRLTMMETLEDALELSNLIPTNEDDEKSLNDSLNLEEAMASTQVKFRVRKKPAKRSSTFDERTLSSYDHLQRSIRSNVLLQEDSTVADASESPSTQTSPPTNRRALLAKTHQSMRNLTSTTTACSAASRPAASDRRSLLANARKKHQSMRNLTTTTNNIPATVPDEGGRRAALAWNQYKSCRTLRRNKTHDGSTSRLHFSFSIQEDDNHQNSHDNQDDLPFLTKRTTTTASKKKNSLDSSPSDHTPTRLSASTDHRRRRLSPKPIPQSISLDPPRRTTFSPMGGRRTRTKKPNDALDRHSDHIVRRGNTLSDLIPYGSSHHASTAGRRGGLALMKSHTTSRRNLLSETSLREDSSRHLLGGRGALLKASQTLSRRDLMESSMRDESSRRDHSFNAMNESTRFFTGSRIRRLDPLL